MSQVIEKITLIGVKKFRSNRSKWGFSPKDLSEYLNISTRTLEFWLIGKTSPNQKQIDSIKNTLLLNGDIDEDWNILDSDDRKSYGQLLKDYSQLEKEFNELKGKYDKLKEDLPGIQAKLIKLHEKTDSLSDDVISRDLEIIRLKDILNKNKLKY